MTSELLENSTQGSVPQGNFQKAVRTTERSKSATTATRPQHRTVATSLASGTLVLRYTPRDLSLAGDGTTS
jgi:hypothetical protein